MIEILRAWDCGKNKVRYATYNEESKRVVLQEQKFDWFFYVKTSDIQEFKPFFSKLKNEGLVNTYESEGKYSKVFVDREHEDEFLDKSMNYSWMYKDRKLNYILKLLDERNVQHFEADLNVTQRWITSADVTFRTNLRVLFLDIETDDSKITGQPIPGEFQILSVGILDAQTGKKCWLCSEDWGDQHEKDMLVKLAKVMNGYDVFCSFNGDHFDFPYIKARFARYGIEIDFRKKFFQDQMMILKKHGIQLPSYSLESLSQHYLQRGKVKHSEKIFQMFNDNRPLLREYNLEDCQLMYEMEQKTHLLEVLRLLNKIGYCPCDEKYVSKRIDNMVLKQTHEDRQYHFKTMDRYKKKSDDDDEEKFQGAYVFEPVRGVHKDVKCIDFTATYPNVIITFRISNDTLITEDNVNDVSPENVITCPNGIKFRKDIMGIFPKLILDVTNKREKYEKLKKEFEPGSVDYEINDRLAYTFKAMGLSFYGVMGLPTSRFFDIRVAESVTLGAQYFIKEVAKYLESNSMPIVYGDSDSLFFSLKNETIIPKIISNISKLLTHHAIKKFNCNECTVNMAYDKGFSSFIIIVKKRYAGMLNSVKGKPINPEKLSIKGLEFVRTDQCLLVRKKQEEMLKMILSKDGFSDEQAKKFVEELKKYVFSNDVKLEDIKLSQKLTKEVDEYKAKTLHIKVAEEMKLDGKEFYIGDKLEYFILCMDTKGDPVPHPVYKYDGKFARSYYWSNKIFPPFQRILEVSNPKIPWETYAMKDVGRKSTVGRMDLW